MRDTESAKVRDPPKLSETIGYDDETPLHREIRLLCDARMAEELREMRKENRAIKKNRKKRARRKAKRKAHP